jgi:CubicO group peptidase (beta-lactamase class C family)
MKKLLAAGCAAILAVAVAVVVVRSAAAPDVEAQVDRVFAKWNTATTPGCAVGAAVGGKPVLAKAYGMADLEHDVKNAPETIFEAGSVSKQFTAASVLLLAREGKLSLDDPVKKYIPELPDAASSILIRHMLNHTSGLRDWGSVEAIAGWPRTSRVYTHAHVLEIVGRQHALNFPPGTRWSYSNTGYNLSTVIVARVSGTAFPEFTRQRLFAPLGMTHTSWRDDHTRIVKNRAVAYDDEKDGFHTDMPFEQVYGNGGLLTTVGDLLKWNENFVTPRVGDAAFVEQQQQPGRFNDGRAHNYALGLTVGMHKGVREVEHSGATAGYRAHLARYPDQHVSVAVLCNVSSGEATQYASAVADLFLGDRLQNTPAPAATYTLSTGDLDRLAGVYRNTETGMSLELSRDQDGLRAQRYGRLVSASGSRAVAASGATWEFDGRGGARVTDPFGTIDVLERVAPARPTVDELKQLAGTYSSDEAETVLTIAVDGDSLIAKRRPDTTLKLTPVYADAFSAPQLGLVIFRRDASRRVTELSVVQDRVWDLRFARQQPARSVSQ